MRNVILHRASFRGVVTALLLCWTLGLAPAVQPDEVLPDPALEARARSLSAQLRCMVCQNQSIDDSAAPLARDLRLLVRERLKDGDSDSAVLDFLVARYGAFVLLRPPLTWHTALLWLTPLLVLVLGAVGVFRLLRRRRREQGHAAMRTPGELSPAERERLARALAPSVAEKA